jgi:CelD/BcsL family acetyltransferase involved in cellulose biosynthesis
MVSATEAVRLRATIAESIRVEVVDDLSRFTEVRPEWNALLRASAADCPFLTWEWLHAWWTHLRGARNLRVLAVRAGDELIGLAPLSVSRRGLPWLSKLEFLGTGYAGSDYLDLIVRPGFETECVRALARSLQSQKFALRLDHLPTRSLTTALADELTEDGWTSFQSPSGACPFTRLTDHSWETYLKTLAPSHQTRFRRYFNTLGKKFDVRFEEATAESQRQEILAALMAFHEQRWSKRGGSTAFQTPALRAFHEDATRRALECGWLRLYVLRLNDMPAAVTYCFAYNRRFYLYQHGFNQQYRQYSVGLVALGLTIRASIEEGALEFDMLYGCEPYKWLWAQDQRRLRRVDLFPADIAGKIHQRTVEAKRSMRVLARRLLSRKVCDSNIPNAGVAS